MGNCAAKKKEQKLVIIRLEDYVKTVDQNNAHDQALTILYQGMNQRAKRIHEPILNGFAKQFIRTADQSQQRNST